MSYIPQEELNWFDENAEELEYGNVGLIVYKKKGKISWIQRVSNVTKKHNGEKCVDNEPISGNTDDV